MASDGAPVKITPEVLVTIVLFFLYNVAVGVLAIVGVMVCLVRKRRQSAEETSLLASAGNRRDPMYTGL